jgi:uncharacterized protein
MEKQRTWRKLDGTRIRRPIEEEIRSVIIKEKKAGHKLRVCIGTDSQVKGKETEFATVIVFVRQGKGGFMYIHNESSVQKMSVKQRMLVEVAKSIEVAYALCRLFTLYDVDMEVHADINTNPGFKSNDALKEAMVISWGWDLRSGQSPMRLPVPVVPIRRCSKHKQSGAREIYPGLKKRTNSSNGRASR